MAGKKPLIKVDNANAEATSATPDADIEEKLRRIDDMEDAMHRAFNSGKADRAEITREAQEAGLEAVRMAGVAMERDDEAQEAARLAIITEGSGDRKRIRAARKRARDARRTAKRAHKQATASAKESYDAIKFSEPGKLGYLRVVQIFYAINIAATLAALQLTSRDTVIYDSVTILDWITVIFEGVGFWFFANYLKIAQPFVMGVSAFELVVPTIVSLINGTFTWGSFILRAGWNIFLIIYFWRSKRVKAVLVNDFASLRFKSADDDVKIRRKGWPFIRNLIMYFIVFSVLGHWMEAGMCQFIRLGLVQGEYDPTNTMLWRDWLYPYPMHGLAVIMISLILYPLWQWLIKKYDPPIIGYALSFLANALTCTCIEFFTGLVVNADLQLWDYTNNFGNIMGQVCLQNALAFGVAASIIAWVAYPMMERALARVPEDVMNIAFVIVLVFGGILWSLYIIDPPENHKVNNPLAETVQSTVSDTGEFSFSLFATETSILEIQDKLDAADNISDEKRKEIQEHILTMQKELMALEVAIANDEVASTTEDDAAKTDAKAEGAKEEDDSADEASDAAAEPDAEADDTTAEAPAKTNAEAAPTEDGAAEADSADDSEGLKAVA